MLHGGYATGVKYWPIGGIAEFLYGNGIKHALGQNARMLPERSSDTYGSTAFLDDTYDYDQNGNVLAITDATTGNRGNRTMEYDDLDRLLTVTSPMYGSTATPGTMTFGYDVLDNITSVRAWNRTLKYCYDDGTNRLTMIRSPWNTSCTTGAATTALGYDVQGNVASKNNTTYEFDFGNRLRSATDGVASTTYVYDAAGRRVRDITGSSRYSLYTQAGQVAYTSDARKRETVNYIYLGGSLVATSRLPTGASTPIVEYQHTDALGTPVVVTNASRGIVQKSDYEPYGKVLNRAVQDGPGFTGHVEDAATGLTYMQQRYYDPQVGWFLSVDPVTAYDKPGQNFNRYWYANNNPYRFTDPDGRRPEDPDTDLTVLVTGIDPDTTPSTMTADQRLVAGVFGAIDLAYGTSAASADAFGTLVSAASPADGPVLDAAFAVKTAKDVMQAVDGLRGVLSAIDGKQRPSSFEQAGQAVGGENGAAVGKLIGTVSTFYGGAKAFANPSGTIQNFTDVFRPLFESEPVLPLLSEDDKSGH